MVESSTNQNMNGQIPYTMKSIMTNYDVYGNPIHHPAVAQQDSTENILPADNHHHRPGGAVNQPSITENNFDVIMNKQNQMKQMHDMRDLMKSLNQETGSLMASRSNFNLNRSMMFGNESNFYNQFGSSSNFKHTGGGPVGLNHPGSSILALSQG